MKRIHWIILGIVVVVGAWWWFTKDAAAQGGGSTPQPGTELGISLVRR
jgi:hypothetical protein